jgi:hypothetical protein
MKTIASLGAAALAATIAAPAAAQPPEREGVPAPLRAPVKTFELGADLGYTQGFGTLLGARSMRDLAGAGLAVGVSVGYRANPLFSIAATGQFQGFNASADLPMGTVARGMSAGVDATFHLAPYDRADPWISTGGGVRAMWEVPEGPAPNAVTTGLEVARLSFGMDLRPSENIAIAPTIGAGLDTFVWQSSPGAMTPPAGSAGISAFVFAGVHGRFDVGGARENPPRRSP